MMNLDESNFYLDFEMVPRQRNTRTDKDDGSARNVIICIPPSLSKSYSEEVERGCRLWQGWRKGEGRDG
ncbi:hypothetical protein EON65_57980, partial [archaeon]